MPSLPQLHIPASITIGFQFLGIYPSFLVPEFFAKIPVDYEEQYNDFIMIGASEGGPELAWLRSFMWLELRVLPFVFSVDSSVNDILTRLFQFPIFFIAARGLWKGKPTHRPFTCTSSWPSTVRQQKHPDVHLTLRRHNCTNDPRVHHHVHRGARCDRREKGLGGVDADATKGAASGIRF